MALQVNLTLSKTYFLPGELVQVCVQIFNETDSIPQDVTRDSANAQVLHIKELSFQANGTERTDPSFVHHLHHPEVPAELTDSRKRVRTIFSTESAVLVSDKALAPHAMQCFQLRFRLPAALPPTFRGSAVRFFYLIHVKAVYEVHKDKVEAVVYETTASTTLTVWPSTTGSMGMQPGSANIADRRNSSLDYSLRSFGSGLGDAPSEPPAPQHARSSKASDAADISGRAETRFSGAGGGASSSPTASGVPLHAAPLPSSASNNYGGMGGYCGDDMDVPMCDYVLGKNCRIKWQEVRSEGTGEGLASFASLDSLSRAADGSASRGAVGAGPVPPPRGVIPFGVNQPFNTPFPLHSALALDTDSDQEDGRGWQSSGSGAPGHAAGTGMVVAPAKASPHVQRQVSGGAPFTRHPSRRNSLFGKVYMLNVGDLPLLRLLLHAPLEAPLQPGATFGGVLDFRQPLATLSPGAAADRPPMTCYGVAVLLETEEVLSSECRPQNKRDGDGLPCGTPYVIRRLHAEHHDITCDSALTSFMFSLPTTAAPSFRTPMVSLRWVLRFELTVGPRVNFATVDKRARSMRPQLEQLVWSLPLNLRSPVSLAR